MTTRYRATLGTVFWVILGTCLGSTGCQHPRPVDQRCHGQVGREFERIAHPPYVIEPPDTLLIEAENIVPKPPYKLQYLDGIALQVSNTLANEPIQGIFYIEPEGTINLGFSYGEVKIVGLTIDEVPEVIKNHLVKQSGLRDPVVQASLAQTRGRQNISGEHLVRPDGNLALGTYGNIYVAGLTLAEAKTVIEKHLAEYLLNPEVTVDVAGFNSKVFYVVIDGGGAGLQILRQPITGNETVLDVISNSGGVGAISSKYRIWIARPTPADVHGSQILPVNWLAITQRGDPRTNYQLLPGDRLFLQADPIAVFTTVFNKYVQPIEQIFGFYLFAQAFEQSIRGGQGIDPFFGGFGFGGFGFPQFPTTPVTPGVP